MKKLLCTVMLLFLCTYSSYAQADSVWGSTDADGQTTEIRIGVDISAAGVPSFFSLTPSVATGIFFNASGNFVNDAGFVYDSTDNDLSVLGNIEATDYCDEAGANCKDPVNILENIAEDTTPQLGGDLDGQTFKIGLGTTTPDHALQITGNTLATSRSKMVGIARASGLALLRVNNTEASPNAITSGNKIGLILFQGHDGTVDTDSGARLTAVATENWTATAHGAKLQLRTVDNTTTSVDTRMTIDQNGHVGIGTDSPNASALLDISTTTLGLLFPRLTTAERDAIGSPVAGLTVYNTTTNTLNAFDSTWAGLLIDNIDVTVAQGGTGAGDAPTALSNLGGIGAATSDTLTNKTFDANGTGNSLSNVETADIAAGSKSGNDATLITGTAGTSGNLAQWNADGDAVDSSVATSTLVLDGEETTALCVPLGTETGLHTTGTAKYTMRAPAAFTVTAVRASLNVAATGGTLFTVDINDGGTTILSTKITIDASEKTSTTAATAPVISDTAIADDAELTFDIDAIGSTLAGEGGKVCVIGTID